MDQTPRKSATRRVIVDAALDLFEAHGLADVTHADIAMAAGIARTTFYEYFASTDDLIAYTVEDRLPENLDRIVASIPSEMSPPQQIRHTVVRLIEFLALEPALGLVMHLEAPKLSDEAQARIAAVHRGISKSLVDAYRRGVADGTIRELHSERLAGALIQDLVMGAARTLLTFEDPKSAVHEIADSVAAFLMDGLAVD